MKIFWPLIAGLILVACADAEKAPMASGEGHDAALSCTDGDGDGFGDGCEQGGDCNDDDPSIHKGCLSCVRPAEGCTCDDSAPPVSCYLDPAQDPEGVVMCREGTRYCRNGAWSGCESIFTYPKPTSTPAQAVINQDAGLEKCSDCRPNCFVVRDNLNPVDGGVGGNGNQTTFGDGGGLTITANPVDAGTLDASATWDAATCMVGSAPDKDCDGVLDQYDPYPTQKPFKTTNPTIFLEAARGATATGTVNLAFYLNSADVYFLMDQTGSMDAERDNLVAALNTGDYVKNSTYNCSDYDFDKVPNNELKAKGIIGAIRCYIRDANFGVGYFRELPFDPYGNTDEIAFKNLQDITGDQNLMATAVNKLAVNSNIDWPEAAMPGLYTLITGNGMNFGTGRTSIPTKTTCPAGMWGYPCFRPDAIPIVVMFTDAPTHNGPTSNTLPYPYNLPLNLTDDGTITALAGAEKYDIAKDIGTVTEKYLSYSGDTTGMASNWNATQFTCGGSPNTTPDTFYQFTLTDTRNVTVTTEGSSFDTVLGIWGGTYGTAATALTVPGTPNTNDNTSNAYSFGDVTGKYLTLSGSTASLKSDFLTTDVGCSAYPGSADATFTFSLSKPANIALDTAGSSIGTSLSLFSGAPMSPTYTSNSNTNDTLSAPENIGPINDLLKAYTGTTNIGTIKADYTGAQLGCGPADDAPDAVYSFSVTGSTRRVRISTEDSALHTVVALLDNGADWLTTPASYSNNDSTTKNPADLGPMEGKSWRISGDSGGLTTDYTFVGCNASGRDAVYKFTLSGTRTVHIDTSGSTVFDTTLALFKGDITAANAITCNDNADASTKTSVIEQSLDAGTYWVVVKGRSSANPTRGAYTLTIQDTAAANVLACDYNSGANGLSSALEADLAPGTYRVIVKGKNAGEKNSYKLHVRDVTALPLGMNRQSCNYNSGPGSKSLINTQLAAGTYTVVLKGDSASAGNYKLTVRDSSAIATDTPLSCNNDQGGTNKTSKISNLMLSPGTYRIGIKGNGTSTYGKYQLHLGVSQVYQPPTWSQTLAALTAHKVHVLSILSCMDDSQHGNVTNGDCNTARTQFTALANATDTLGTNGSPLVYDISSNGTGLSDTVVKGITELAQYLEMNVSAQVVFQPDANPGFQLNLKAVDAAGDGCDGLIGAEHQKCVPGATPRFDISFTNPQNAPVPINPNDPKGGYNFKAQLIANGQFIVDEVPIYIIPENVVNVPPPPVYNTTGTYAQDLAGMACTEKTDLPDWGDLTWSANIPNGTSVTFNACGGGTTASLATCTQVPLCKITGGAACSTTNPCPSGSICSPNNNCWRITGNSCTDNSKCGTGATCQSGTCVWASQPIDVGQLLNTQNYQPNLRVKIDLTANTTANTAPTINDWSINYTCKSTL